MGLSMDPPEEYYGISASRVFTRSDDGITWSVQATGAGGSDGTAIIHANGLYCFCHWAGWAWSPDGITWTLKPLGTVTSNRYYGVAYGVGYWVFGGTNNNTSKVFRQVLGDPAGAVANITVGTAPIVYDVIFADGAFIAVTGPTAEIYRSVDAITWTVVYGPVGSVNILRVMYLNNGYLAVGSNQLLQSSDGISWVSIPIAFTFQDITYYKGQYYFLQLDGVYSSTDLVTFTREIGPGVGSFRTISSTKKNVVAAGEIGRRAYRPPVPWVNGLLTDALSRTMIRSRIK